MPPPNARNVSAALHPPGRPRLKSAWVLLALALLVSACYANCLTNAFQLDDIYGLQNNVWVRSLRNIPRFFSDPFSLTSFKRNADYRPILQISFALNYAVSGYSTWSWHALNLVLHWIVAANVFLLGRLLLGSGRLGDLPWLDPADGDAVACAAALVFAVHPITTGCVNYLWARSSLLVAAWLAPAIVSYLRALRDRRRPVGFLPSLLLYALALFTKAEAISFLGLIALAEILWGSRSAAGPASGRALRSLLRLAPFLVVTAVYLPIRQALIPEFVVQARQTGTVTAYPYFLTQLSAWWYYVGKLLLPINLVADETGFPISRSITDPAVLIAGAGWVLVLVLLAWTARRAPALSFLGLWFFIVLAPTSSIMILPEMVNEHRPYLPDAGPLILLVLGLFLLATRLPRRNAAFAACVAVLVITLGTATHLRNRVWKDDLTLWADTVEHSPLSPRAHMAYGLALLDRSALPEAERQFREAIRLSPTYFQARSNLALILEQKGELAEAMQQHDEAVRLAPQESSTYYGRGMCRRRNGDLAGAIEDLDKAAARSVQPQKALAAMADCLQEQGRLSEAAAIRKRMEQAGG